MIAAAGLPSHSPARRLIEGQGTDERRWQASPVIAGLPNGDVADWATRFERIWLLAPHPDDEVLALGGTLARLASLGAAISIVAVTDGEASHGNSATWTPERLAATRPIEMRRGLDALGVDADIVRLGLPDGRVGAHRRRLLRMLVERVGERDLLLATCRFDGHPDHEACGDVAALVADLTGATVFEYPVWMWHWASPDEASIPWTRAQRMPLETGTLEKKSRAIRQFASQLEADGPRPAVLPPYVLPRFMRPFEVVFT